MKRINVKAAADKLPFAVHEINDIPEQESTRSGKYVDGVRFLLEHPKKAISYDAPEDANKRRAMQASALTAAREMGVEVETSFRVGKVWVTLSKAEREKQLKKAK